MGITAGITRAAAAAGRVGSEQDTDTEKDTTLDNADAQIVEVDGRRQYFRLQDRWSESIIDWITGLLIFNCILVLLVGVGLLNYDKTPWLITAFVTEIFLQVIGLGYIAARFLFPGSVEKRAGGKATKAKSSTKAE